ncbi:hypothetical protein V6N13_142229 [Hibiscus sabdariffa]
MVRDAGYRTIMWFAYVVPCEKLEDGTTIAWDDDSFRNMIEHCKMGALHVYVEHRVDIPKYADYESNDDVLKIYYESRVGTRVNGGPASSVVGEASNVAVGDSKDAFEGESKATFEVKGKGKGKGKGKVAFEEKGKGEASLQGDAKGEASFEKDGGSGQPAVHSDRSILNETADDSVKRETISHVCLWSYRNGEACDANSRNVEHEIWGLMYFTIILHHGGFMENSPRFRYTRDKVTFFDMCHVDSMSMLEMYDIVEGLGVSGLTVILGVKGFKPVTTETHIRTEAVEPITRTDIRTESEDDSEDSDYVVVDISDGDSGFEESEIDMSDEEGFSHDVYVGIPMEIKCTNLNSNLLGGLPAMTLNDENVGIDDLHSASESDSDGEFTKNRKPRCLEFQSESESEDDSEDSDYVVVDISDGDSGFEESEIDMSDEEGFAHDVYVGIQMEIDCTNLNSNLLGGLPAMTLNDENVGVDDLHSASESDSDGEFTKNRKLRADPTYSSRLLKKDVMVDHVYNVSYGLLWRNFLAVVAIDANDSIYPLAYAVVEAENQSSWSWFLSLLVTDLEIGSFENITILSDKQNGLVEVISEVFLCAEHRTCVRHLYSNFKNKENSKAKNLKDALWKATRATYVKEFEDAMAELKTLLVPAFD